MDADLTIAVEVYDPAFNLGASAHASSFHKNQEFITFTIMTEERI